MKKRGKKIKNNIALIPLGAKTTKFERDLLAGLLAMSAGCMLEEHVLDFFVLADLVLRMNGPEYSIVHASSIKNLCGEIYQPDCSCRATNLHYQQMKASVNVLIRYLHEQNNMKVFNAAMCAVNEFNV